ncbi:hypothetical protein EVAR_92129_1 [Eumeta japonica]|uniref:Uncharacterized protein n=1 Tax=Eumeta variegata TaxID=151549 RepID=A0A4C1SYH5_EUMVA|nr:hypothetical protein EVAR_92129_1 [Eumeta japonica]
MRIVITISACARPEIAFRPNNGPSHGRTPAPPPPPRAPLDRCRAICIETDLCHGRVFNPRAAGGERNLEPRAIAQYCINKASRTMRFNSSPRGEMLSAKGCTPAGARRARTCSLNKCRATTVRSLLLNLLTVLV